MQGYFTGHDEEGEKERCFNNLESAAHSTLTEKERTLSLSSTMAAKKFNYQTGFHMAARSRYEVHADFRLQAIPAMALADSDG